MEQMCADLAAEHLDLDGNVAGLADAEWSTPTPSPGWAIRDQISHLWFFDQRATMALTDPSAFAADLQSIVDNIGTDPSIAVGREIEPAELLQHWRADRDQLLRVAATIDPAARVPWYGPAMAARSFVTARLMETWAHGQDVADALGVTRPATARLRHVAHIGVRARPFSYAIHGMTMPEVDVVVHLEGPAGEQWRWGESHDPSPEPSEQPGDFVSGSALDFCLVVTQRRHLADTSLSVVGQAAIEWMAIAQAFAGGVGPGRQAGQFATPGSAVTDQ
jgi:uncharacterized protein (TIGR03084 family)